MSVKLLTAHHLEFLGLKGGCTGLSVSTLVKMPHCWKSHVTAHLIHGFVLSIQFASSEYLYQDSVNPLLTNGRFHKV